MSSGFATHNAAVSQFTSKQIKAPWMEKLKITKIHIDKYVFIFVFNVKPE